MNHDGYRRVEDGGAFWAAKRDGYGMFDANSCLAQYPGFGDGQMTDCAFGRFRQTSIAGKPAHAAK